MVFVCQQPPAKKQKKGKGKRAAEQVQSQEAAAPGSPEAEPNYKSVCRQLQQKKPATWQSLPAS